MSLRAAIRAKVEAANIAHVSGDEQARGGGSRGRPHRICLSSVSESGRLKRLRFSTVTGLRPVAARPAAASASSIGVSISTA